MAGSFLRGVGLVAAGGLLGWMITTTEVKKADAAMTVFDPTTWAEVSSVLSQLKSVYSTMKDVYQTAMDQLNYIRQIYGDIAGAAALVQDVVTAPDKFAKDAFHCLFTLPMIDFPTNVISVCQAMDYVSRNLMIEDAGQVGSTGASIDRQKYQDAQRNRRIKAQEADLVSIALGEVGRQDVKDMAQRLNSVAAQVQANVTGAAGDALRNKLLLMQVELLIRMRGDLAQLLQLEGYKDLENRPMAFTRWGGTKP